VARKDRPTMVADGVLPSSLTTSPMISAGGNWLPASITPIVSTMPTRERSITIGGASLRSKPVTKSAMVALTGLTGGAAFGAAAAPGCCCAAAISGRPISVAAPAPSRDRRSKECPLLSFAITQYSARQGRPATLVRIL
jgi:hypothetical protein